jgi:hypothetical protein
MPTSIDKPPKQLVLCASPFEVSHTAAQFILRTHVSLSRFLYSLTLAIDANFRLKNRFSSGSDTSLGSGWAYFVENKRYKEYIAQHVTEKDVSVPPELNIDLS